MNKNRQFLLALGIVGMLATVLPWIESTDDNLVSLLKTMADLASMVAQQSGVSSGPPPSFEGQITEMGSPISGLNLHLLVNLLADIGQTIERTPGTPSALPPFGLLGGASFGVVALASILGDRKTPLSIMHRLLIGGSLLFAACFGLGLIFTIFWFFNLMMESASQGGALAQMGIGMMIWTINIGVGLQLIVGCGALGLVTTTLARRNLNHPLLLLSAAFVALGTAVRLSGPEGLKMSYFAMSAMCKASNLHFDECATAYNISIGLTLAALISALLAVRQAFKAPVDPAEPPRLAA